MSLLEKIRLASIVNTKLTFYAFLAFAVLLLITSNFVYTFFIKKYVKETAYFVDTSPIWERTRGDREEFFFKINYEFKADDEKYNFHFEEGYFDRKTTEMALSNVDASEVVSLWYDKRDPNEMEFKDPNKLSSSPFFLAFHLSGFLLFLGMFVRQVNRIVDDEEFRLRTNSKDVLSYEMVSNDGIAFSFRLKIIIQFILIVCLGLYFNHSIEWIFIITWTVLSLEMAYSLRMDMEENSKIFDDINTDLTTQIKLTTKKFGEIFEEHFGIKGSGSIHYDAVGASLGIIVFIYLPFIVLPLLIINFIRFFFDLVILVTNAISLFLMKIWLNGTSSNLEKTTIALIYAFTFYGFILFLLHTTLIK